MNGRTAIRSLIKRAKIIELAGVICASFLAGWVCFYRLNNVWFAIFLCSLVFLYYIVHRVSDLDREKAAIKSINEKFPALQNSGDLLLKEKPNPMEQLQITRIEKALNDLKLRSSFSLNGYHILILLALLSFLIPSYSSESDKSHLRMPKASPNEAKKELEKTRHLPLEVLQSAWRIVPPAYMNLPSKNLEDLEELTEIWTGSTLKHELNFNQKLKSFNCNSSEAWDKDYSTADSKQFSLRKLITQDILFNYEAFSADDSLRSKIYRITTKADLPPQIDLSEQAPYLKLKADSIKSYPITVRIKDDFKVKNAELTLTLSRGKGEAVKFNEMTFPLGINVAKQVETKFVLEFDEYEIEPGDQLYYHVIARDNKLPVTGETRSSTYMIELEDTVIRSTFAGGGMAMDIMPAYFRSQRQLIIDTKKLLADGSQLSETEFFNKSNSIASEQKILRLRYGKFLGEEAESSAGGHHARPADEHAYHDEHEHEHEHEDEDEHEHEQEEKGNHDHESGHKHEDDHNDKHKHEHDADCEHEQASEDHDHDHADSQKHDHLHDDESSAVDKKNTKEDLLEKKKEVKNKVAISEEHEGHDHGHDHGAPQEISGDKTQSNEVLLADYAHFHDNMEEASFFDEGIKSKLRAALNFMWKSELELRLANPKASLPYQEEALRLIKWIQQDSRIYVERIGLEIPQINENKSRLQGDQKGSLSSQAALNERLNLWKDSETLLIALQEKDSKGMRAAWTACQQECTKNILTQEFLDLELLSLLKRGSSLINAKSELDNQLLFEVECALLRILPENSLNSSGNIRRNSLSELRSIYRKQMQEY